MLVGTRTHLCERWREAHLSSSNVLLVQASADISLLASLANVALLNCDQPKFHSASSPAAMALQYTAERRLGSILTRELKMH